MGKDRKRRKTGFQDIEEKDFNITVEAHVAGKKESHFIPVTDDISDIAGFDIITQEPTVQEATNCGFEDVDVDIEGTGIVHTFKNKSVNQPYLGISNIFYGF